MSTDDAPQDRSPTVNEEPQAPTQPQANDASAIKKRPRLDLTADGGRERKRGKSMFGILLGTLNKAKIEDKERNASEAAKKRQKIEERLQAKLRKETDSVRRAEEAKKDKTAATRKEEELQLKDSVYKLRRKRLPLLANFLLTSDNILSTESPSNPLAPPPRGHPPPLYYLPAVLTPEQEAFVNRRKAEAAEATQKEWQEWKTQREAGVDEIKQFRQRVAEELERKKAEKAASGDVDAEMEPSDEKANDDSTVNKGEADADKPRRSSREDAEMDVDDTGGPPSGDSKSNDDKKDEVSMQGDDDDAVEY